MNLYSMKIPQWVKRNENTTMGETYSKDYLTKPNVAFKAYDEFALI